MTRILSIIVLMVLACAGVRGQGQYSYAVADAPALVALNPNGIRLAILTNSLGAFRYDSASSTATNTSTVFKPLNYNGRWIRIDIPSSSNAADKLATNNGTAYALGLGDATANRAAAIGADGKLTNAAPTITELNYLSGVSSAIQGQINGKLASTDIDTSAKVRAILTDETGTGAAVFGTDPTVTATATGGSTSRTLAARFSDAINVLDFGADTADGSSDVTAINNAAAAGSAIRFPAGTYNITTSLTFANTKAVIVSAGATFKISTGATLTINGDLQAPNLRIFDVDSGTSAVVFGSRNRTRSIHPIWFGVTPDNGGSDQTRFRKCFESATGKTEILLTPGVYVMSDTITVATGIRVRGLGTLGQVQINFDPTSDDKYMFSVADNAQDVSFENIAFVNANAASGNTVTGTSGVLVGANTKRVEFLGCKFGAFHGIALNFSSNTQYPIVRDNYFIQNSNGVTNYGVGPLPAIAILSTNLIGGGVFENNRINEGDKAVHIHGTTAASSEVVGFVFNNNKIENVGRAGISVTNICDFIQILDATYIGNYIEACQTTHGGAAVKLTNPRSFIWAGGVLASDISGVTYSTNMIAIDGGFRGAIVGTRFNNVGAGGYYISTANGFANLDAIGCSFDLGVAGTEATDAELRARLSGNVTIHPKVKPSSNQVLGMDSAGQIMEGKTITAGANVTVTHGANSITIASTSGGSGITGTVVNPGTIPNGNIPQISAQTNLVESPVNVSGGTNITVTGKAHAHGLVVTNFIAVGGETASHAGLKGVGSAIQARAGDDSAFGAFEAQLFIGQADSYFYWNTRSRMASPADGKITLFNAALNDFSMLNFGGTSSSYPAWKRSGAGFVARLADDSANAALTAASATVDAEAYDSSGWDGDNTTPTKNDVRDKIESSFKDPRDGYVIVDHFIGVNLSNGQSGDTAWVNSSAGASAGPAVSSLVPAASHPGQIRLGTGSTSTGVAIIRKDSSTMYLGDGEVVQEFVIYIPDLSTVADEFVIRFGLGDAASNADHVDGVYFEYDRTASVNWRTKSSANSSRTATNSSTAVAEDTWIRGTLVGNSGGTSVAFYLNGTLIHTETTNLPTGTSRTLTPHVFIGKSAGTNSRSVIVDYSKTTHTFAAQIP